MFENGTVMNGKMIESPQSFQVACTVMTQIIAAVASSQYGGQSVDISHLGKYLRRSYEKFKRNIAAREGFVELCPETKTVFVKEGEKKWKPWDTEVSRREDNSYIDGRKELYSGLCFTNKKEAQAFMNRHKKELDALASQNPLFDHWSIMTVIKRFEPHTKVVYGKDIKED